MQDLTFRSEAVMRREIEVIRAQLRRNDVEVGDRAAEIVHIGQAVLSMSGTIEYFRDTVFNYPTLAEAYKVAALDSLNKL